MAKFLDHAGLVYYNQVIDNKLKKKQDTISDLDSIRSQAATGASLQSKVNSIIDGAEPNKISAITFNGAEVSVDNKTANIVFNAYTKTETDNKIGEKIAEVVAGADTAYDTLKEIADWILAYPDDAASLISKITTIEQNTADLATIRANALAGKNYATLHKDDEEGAQVNKIEVITINGVPAPISSKTVNIDVSASLNLSEEQRDALNSGISSDKVAAYDAYAVLIDKKLDATDVMALTTTEIDVLLGIQN